MLEPRDQRIDEFDEVQERRAANFEAQKLWKSWSGIACKSPSYSHALNKLSSLGITREKQQISSQH